MIDSSQCMAKPIQCCKVKKKKKKKRRTETLKKKKNSVRVSMLKTLHTNLNLDYSKYFQNSYKEIKIL